MTDSKRAINANMLILIVAAMLLSAAIGYTVWRDRATDAPAAESAAAPADGQLAALEARTRSEPDNAGAWQALGAARFDLGDFSGAVAPDLTIDLPVFS